MHSSTESGGDARTTHGFTHHERAELWSGQRAQRTEKAAGRQPDGGGDDDVVHVRASFAWVPVL